MQCSSITLTKKIPNLNSLLLTALLVVFLVDLSVFSVEEGQNSDNEIKNLEERRLSNNNVSDVECEEGLEVEAKSVCIMSDDVDEEIYKATGPEDILTTETTSVTVKKRINPILVLVIGISTIVGLVMNFSYLVKVKSNY